MTTAERIHLPQGAKTAKTGPWLISDPDDPSNRPNQTLAYRIPGKELVVCVHKPLTDCDCVAVVTAFIEEVK